MCADGVRTSGEWGADDGDPAGMWYNPTGIPWLLTPVGEITISIIVTKTNQ